MAKWIIVNDTSQHGRKQAINLDTIPELTITIQQPNAIQVQLPPMQGHGGYQLLGKQAEEVWNYIQEFGIAEQ